MKATVTRCDICGSDSTDENPVCVTVSGFRKAEHAREVTERSYFPVSIFYGTEPTPPDIDMCQQCAAGMLDIVKASVARRRIERKAREAAKPAQPTEAWGVINSGPITITGTFHNFLKGDE
jgi:hypothetical protein